MIRSSIKITFIIFIILPAMAVIFLNKYVFKDASIFYPDFIKNALVIGWDKTGNIKLAATEFKNWRKLAQENEELRHKNNEFIRAAAALDDLKNENEFLRKALNIIPKINRDTAYGNVFNLSLAPGGYSMLINKGTDDGIEENAAVITEEGILVGQVRQVFKNFSKILFIADPNFKINAKVAGSDTVGIARGALKDGLLFDLIVQGDQIKEGDLIVSSGNDLMPSALNIGTVSLVEVNETKIFKKVKIMPAVNKIKLGRVLIIKP